MVHWSEIEWGDVAFVGTVVSIFIAIGIVMFFEMTKPSYEEKIAKITRPQFIAYCDNSVSDGVKIKAWRVYEDVTVLYNMDGTKTTITAAGVCTFKEIR